MQSDPFKTACGGQTLTTLDPNWSFFFGNKRTIIFGLLPSVTPPQGALN
jgi:hypothetical protein